MKTPESLDGFFAGSTSVDSERCWIVAVINNELLVPTTPGESTQLAIDVNEADTLKFFCNKRLCLGQWMGDDCEVWDLMPESAECEGFIKTELRSFLAQSDDAEFSLASRAVQLLDWHKKNQFCGQCGEANNHSKKEHSLFCERCNINHYPRISPCVIVAVTYGDRCLFARHPAWPQNRFSTLAGFIEAGESAEQALHREVFEEVGIEIKNIRYIGSQAWPYPGQLMLGYIAEAKNDTIKVDGVEIAEAHWHRYDDLPAVLAPPTIMAGKLIRQFVLESAAKYK